MKKLFVYLLIASLCFFSCGQDTECNIEIEKKDYIQVDEDENGIPSYVNGHVITLTCKYDNKNFVETREVTDESKIKSVTCEMKKRIRERVDNYKELQELTKELESDLGCE